MEDGITIDEDVDLIGGEIGGEPLDMKTQWLDNDTYFLRAANSAI